MYFLVINFINCIFQLISEAVEKSQSHTLAREKRKTEILVLFRCHLFNLMAHSTTNKCREDVFFFSLFIFWAVKQCIALINNALPLKFIHLSPGFFKWSEMLLWLCYGYCFDQFHGSLIYQLPLVITQFSNIYSSLQNFVQNLYSSMFSVTKCQTQFSLLLDMYAIIHQISIFTAYLARVLFYRGLTTDIKIEFLLPITF